MNSPNKLYEELLKEHPELKNSQEDIQEIIASLQKINPEIQPDEVFKSNLKQRLKTIASYNPSKSPGYFGFLKYFVPVFTFGFAIFGFMYFSQDTNIPLQNENIDIQSQDMGIQSTSLMAEPLMIAEDTNEAAPITMGVKSRQTPTPGVTSLKKTIDLQMATDLADFPGENDEMESLEVNIDDIAPMGFALMDTASEELIDDFKDICLNENGLIKDLEEGERICILEEISCLESDYKKEKCLLKDKQ